MGMMQQAKEGMGEMPTEGMPMPEKGMPMGEEPAETGEGEAATPEEQAEYERALGALYTVLYKNEGVSRSIVDQLQPAEKIGSIAKAALLVITQIDKQIQLDEVVIPQLTMDTVDRLIEMAERVKGMTFSDKEAEAALGTAFEGVLEAYGITPEDAQALMEAMSPEEQKQAQAAYQGALDGAPGAAEQMQGGEQKAASAPVAEEEA